MNRLLLLLAASLLAVAALSAQDAVLLKGPYQPDSKYKYSITRNASLNIQFNADSSVLNRMKSKGVANPLTENDTIRSEAIITTGDSTAGGRFPLTSEISFINKNIPPGEKMVLYGSATASTTPDLDSMAIIPSSKESDAVKEQLFQVLRNMFRYTQPPDRPFHIGDTASGDIMMPMNLFGIQMKLKIHSLYKLISIENNIASFDMDYAISMDITGSQNVIANGNGGGSGKGNFTYDVVNKYFPFNESNIQMQAMMQFYNPAENQNIKMNMKENMHSIVRNEKLFQ